WRELRTRLDEELNRLPEKYRLPLVLCYLEGKTNEEAARLLGWPTGSMSARLARGRELLRDRLTGARALPAGHFALLPAQQAGPAGVPDWLESTAVRGGLGFAGIKELAAGELTPRAIEWAEATLHASSGGKRLSLAALLALVLLLALGAAAAGYAAFGMKF